MHSLALGSAQQVRRVAAARPKTVLCRVGLLTHMRRRLGILLEGWLAVVCMTDNAPDGQQGFRKQAVVPRRACLLGRSTLRW